MPKPIDTDQEFVWTYNYGRVMKRKRKLALKDAKWRPEMRFFLTEAGARKYAVDCASEDVKAARLNAKRAEARLEQARRALDNAVVDEAFR